MRDLHHNFKIFIFGAKGKCGRALWKVTKHLADIRQQGASDVAIFIGKSVAVKPYLPVQFSLSNEDEKQPYKRWLVEAVIYCPGLHLKTVLPTLVRKWYEVQHSRLDYGLGAKNPDINVTTFLFTFIYYLLR